MKVVAVPIRHSVDLSADIYRSQLPATERGAPITILLAAVAMREISAPIPINAGSRNSRMNVANASPKQRVSAIGIRNCACRLFSNRSGDIPPMVVRVVSRMARKRSAAAPVAANSSCSPEGKALVHAVNQHDGSVDDDTRQPEQADEREQSHVEAHCVVARHHAHETKRNNGHDQQRLQPALEHECQDQVDEQQRQYRADPEVRKCLPLRFRTPLERGLYPMIRRRSGKAFCSSAAIT